MTQVYQENLQRIESRWPILAQLISMADIASLHLDIIEKQAVTVKVNDVQLCSAYDPVEEAFSYRSLSSGHEYHIWGLGLGHLPDLLVADNSAETIHIYLYNLELTRLVLSLVSFSWLNDPRIQLHFVSEDQIDFMANLNKLNHPGCIVINSDKVISKKTHQWLFFRMEGVIAKHHVHRLQLDNDEKFIQIEHENSALLKKLTPIDGYLNHQIKDAICIGAGPSLQAHIDELKEIYQQEQRPMLFAAATACKCLLENDIKPDVVMAIDIDIPESYIPFAIASDTVFLFASRMKKSIIEKWQGEKYYLNLADETYDRINQTFPTAFRPYIHGSVIHPIIHTALTQGATTIKLLGCDFGFPGGVIHASMENNPEDHNTSMQELIENGHGELIKTSPTYRMFASGVENLIGLAPHAKFYNWSRMGARILGAEYLDMEKSYV
jgi:hypothetical protein